MAAKHFVRLFALLISMGWLMAASCTAAVADEADTHDGVVVSAGNGRLSMTATDGKQQSYEIGEMVKITVNGHMGRLEDLKVGARIRVTSDKNGRVMDVATLDSNKQTLASQQSSTFPN